MSMAASIESRVPFLDHKLVEYVGAAAGRVEAVGLDDQARAARAMKGLLPDSILNRPKMGFPVPFARLDAGRRGTRSRATCCSIAAPASAASSIRQAVDALLRDHAAGRTDDGDRIWSLLNLELWHRTFIDQEGDPDAASSDIGRFCGAHRSRARFARRGRLMRMLWLKSDLLLPLDKGGKLRTWHLMRHLARHHEITYLAFREPGQPAADVEGMTEVAARVETIARREPAKGTLRFYAGAALHLVDPLPYAVGKYRSAAFRRRLERLLEEQHFNLIVCDFLFPAVNLPRRLPCPAVMFTHNVESENLAPSCGDQARPCRSLPVRRAAPADASLRTAHARPLRRRAGGLERRPRDVLAAYPAPSAGRSTSSRPASTRNTSARRSTTIRHSQSDQYVEVDDLHGLHGLAAE